MMNQDIELNDFDDLIQGDAASGEPEDIRTFKNGKIIIKGSKILKFIFVFLAIAIFITLGILFKKQINDFFVKTFGATSDKQTNYEKQFTKSRAIYATTKGLYKFTKNLRPQDIVKGLDVDLFDNDRKIKPGDYNIKILPGSYNFSIIIDLQNNNNFENKKISTLLKFLSSLKVKVSNKDIKKRFNLFAYYKNRPQEILSNKKQLSLKAIIKICNSQSNSRKKTDIIKYALNKLAKKDLNTHQIIYISDYDITEKKSFKPVFLYNFFKKNINYQFYAFSFGKNISSDSNPFSYLKNNHKDFKRARWNFGNFSLNSSMNKKLYSQLEEILTKAPPVRGIEFEYFPKKTYFKDDAKNKHELTIKLRKARNDLKLTALPKQLYTPHYYLYKLSNKYDFSTTKITLTDDKTFTSKNEFIIGLKSKSINIQKTIGKIANLLDSEIVAGLHNSTFLLKTKDKINYPKKIAILKKQNKIFKQIRFITKNRYFPDELHIKEKKPNNELVLNWQKRILQKNKKLQNINFKNKVFMFVNGESNFKNQNIKKIKKFRLAPYNANKNNPLINSSILLETLTRDWNIKYDFVQPIISSSPGYTSKDSYINYTSGFDLLNGLNEIINDNSAVNSFIFIGNSSIIPSLWPKDNIGLDKEFKNIYATLNRLKAIVIAPLPSYKKNIKIVPQKNLFTAIALNYYEKRSISYQRNQVPEQGFKQWYPIPGENIYSIKRKKICGGNSIAAAGLIPIIAIIKNRIKDISNADISEIIYNSVSKRGDLINKNLIHNRGIVTPRMLTKIISNRIFQRKNIINFNNLKKMAYVHIDTILYGKFSNEVHAATGITALPYKKEARFTKTYQYYDRSFLFSGIKQGDALYNLNSKFNVSQIERKELAVISFRGTVFLLCTRNRHRGWILNLESIIPSKNINGSQHIQYDDKNNLIFIFTGHGEILAIDMLRGLIQNIFIKTKDKFTYEGKSLPTDHGMGNGYLKIDAQNQNIWVYGTGSRYLKLFHYKRQNNNLFITYNNDADCNKKAITSTQMLADTKIIHRFSPPILFTTGTINIIGYPEKGEKDGIYLKFDLNGKKI